MSKEQIEEMAKALEKVTFGVNNQTLADRCFNPETINKVAEGLYKAGYRKQEWISVKDRLPELYESVLVFCKLGVSRLQCVSEMIEPHGKRWSEVCGLPVTHWMPLPEPPKMKGGAD